MRSSVGKYIRLQNSSAQHLFTCRHTQRKQEWIKPWTSSSQHGSATWFECSNECVSVHIKSKHNNNDYDHGNKNENINTDNHTNDNNYKSNNSSSWSNNDNNNRHHHYHDNDKKMKIATPLLLLLLPPPPPLPPPLLLLLRRRRRLLLLLLLLLLLTSNVGLVVKASASRAEGPGLESRLRRDFSGVESHQWLKNWHSSGYPARRLA